MADARFSHDWNRDRGLNFFNHVGIRHSCHAALRAYICRNSLKCHNGYGPGIFGDLCLFGIHDIHDDSAFEHLCHAALDSTSTRNVRHCNPHFLKPRLRTHILLCRRRARARRNKRKVRLILAQRNPDLAWCKSDSSSI